MKKQSSKTSPFINVILKENGKTVQILNSHSPTRVRVILQRELLAERKLKGFCQVHYKRGLQNSFDFKSYSDFKEKFKPCVEKSLLNYLGVS